MPGIAKWWCQLFGYVDCEVLSTFEAIILAGIVYVVIIFVLGIIHIIFTLANS